MDIQATMDWIARWEGGPATTAYMDSKGHPTIGIGFNLDRFGAAQAIAALGLDYNQVRAGQQSLTTDQINQLFKQDVNTAVENARQKLPIFDALPDPAQMVVVDMIFNLGVQGFAEFTKMIGALISGDWGAAASEMVNSAWYTQTGQRSKDDVGVIQQLATAAPGSDAQNNAQTAMSASSSPPGGTLRSSTDGAGGSTGSST